MIVVINRTNIKHRHQTVRGTMRANQCDSHNIIRQRALRQAQNADCYASNSGYYDFIINSIRVRTRVALGSEKGSNCDNSAGNRLAPITQKAQRSSGDTVPHHFLSTIRRIKCKNPSPDHIHRQPAAPPSQANKVLLASQNRQFDAN